MTMRRTAVLVVTVLTVLVTVLVTVLGTAGPATAGGSCGDVLPPTRPRDFYAMPGNHSAWLQWGAPRQDYGAHVDKYQIRQRGGGDGIVLHTVRGPQRDVRGLDNGEKYWFKVRAHNAAGWGRWTRERWVIPGPIELPHPGVGAAQVPLAHAGCCTETACC